MILIKKKEFEELTLDFILSKVSEFDLYKWEIPNLSLSQAVCNPCRRDRSPSLSVYINGTGHLKHCDFADSTYIGGPIDFICQRYGLNYDKALQYIAKNFGLLENIEIYKQITSQYVKPILDVKRHSLIQIKARKWENQDLKYWADYGITLDELRKENVYCVKEYYINHRKGVLKSNERCFAYQFDNGYKLYFVDRPKGEKWASNITTKTIENLQAIDICDKVIITKSRKDRICLSKYFPCVINVQNEQASNLTPELAELLKEKEVWLNYDSDSSGKQASIRGTTGLPYGYKHINVPDKYYPIKDFADMIKVGLEKEMIEHFKSKNLL